VYLNNKVFAKFADSPIASARLYYQAESEQQKFVGECEKLFVDQRLKSFVINHSLGDNTAVVGPQASVTVEKLTPAELEVHERVQILVCKRSWHFYELHIKYCSFRNNYVQAFKKIGFVSASYRDKMTIGMWTDFVNGFWTI